MTQPGPVLARGSRSAVHRWGDHAVVKVPLPEVPEGWIRYEAQYIDAARAAGAPVPACHGIVVIGGREAALYERIDGPSLWDLARSGALAPRTLGQRLGELHTAIHALVPPVTLPSQRTRLSCKIREAVRAGLAGTVAPSSAGDAGDAGDDVLIELGPACARLSLCHGDFHPNNVIASARGPVVVDWFDATRGEAIGDIARTSLLLGGGAVTLADRTNLQPSQLSFLTHLPGATVELVSAVHDVYVDTVLLLGGHAYDDLLRWRAVAATARLAERVTATRPG